ncbi:hypothetical protein GDO78_014183 [Eleutherodactylus coqui]|uniref:Uncharacterized protein n=1 Tax=Eleutherodactylus coqui TaxID=57060 RepID=A0A8J6BCI0_ELECQ|nr:hypothetical protein GDO78_014183 [Eleutherodactylus coqui]
MPSCYCHSPGYKQIMGEILVLSPDVFIHSSWSPVNSLFCRVNDSNFDNLSGYSSPPTPFISLVALLWTPSSTAKSFLSTSDQNCTLYSM